MGWEAAPAVDVEHMPLMIHTLCAVGRWWLPSPLPFPPSRMGLLHFFLFQCCVFFSPLHTWKLEGSWNVLFMHSCSCIIALLILLKSWTELNKQHLTLLFSQTWSSLCYSNFCTLLFRFPHVRLKLPSSVGCASFFETLMAVGYFLLFHYDKFDSSSLAVWFRVGQHEW